MRSSTDCKLKFLIEPWTMHKYDNHINNQEHPVSLTKRTRFFSHHYPPHIISSIQWELQKSASDFAPCIMCGEGGPCFFCSVIKYDKRLPLSDWESKGPTIMVLQAGLHSVAIMNWRLKINLDGRKELRVLCVEVTYITQRKGTDVEFRISFITPADVCRILLRIHTLLR